MRRAADELFPSRSAPERRRSAALAVALAVALAGEAMAGEPAPTIAVTAQVGGAMVPLECGGGLAPPVLANVARELAGAPTLLAIDSGDLIGAGALPRLLVDWDAARLADAVVATGLRALAVGHRDLGAPRNLLLRVVSAMRARGLPHVLSNLRCAPSAAALCDGIVDAGDAPLLLDTPAGKVAFVAVVDPAALQRVARDRAEGLTLEEPAVALRRAVAQARRQGAWKVVASFDPARHRGLDEALPMLDRLGPGDGPDLLLVNEAHPGVASLTTPAGLPVVATRAEHAVLATLGPVASRREPPAGELPPPVARFIDDAHAWLCAEHHRPLAGAALDGPLDRDGFAALLLDVARQAERADVALINRGAVRASGLFPIVGAVTTLDVLAALPFDDHPHVGRLTGAALRDLLRSPEVARLYLRGLERSGDRVLVNGRPVDDTARYRVVSTGFLAEGGDGLVALQRAGLRPDRRAGLRDLLLDWLGRPRPGGRLASPEDPALRPRWTLRATLDASFTSVDIRNPGRAYADAQLLRSQNTTVRAETELRADADHPAWLWESSLRLRYGMARTISQSGTDTGYVENSDLVVGRSTMTRRLRAGLPRWYDPLPFAESYTETEMTQPDSRGYHHLESRLVAGLRFQPLGRMTIQGGLGVGWELLAPGSVPSLAVVAGWALPPTRLFTILGRAVEAQGALDLAWRDPVNSSDLTIRLGLKVAVPIWDLLALTVGYDLFARQAPGLEWAWASDVNVGLRIGYAHAVQTFAR